MNRTQKEKGKRKEVSREARLFYFFPKVRKFGIVTNMDEVVRIEVPESFDLRRVAFDEFDRFLSRFDWSIQGTSVEFDWKDVDRFNYQLMALVAAYKQYLISRGCRVIETSYSDRNDTNGLDYWPDLSGAEPIIVEENTATGRKGKASIPSLLISNTHDREEALKFAEWYLHDRNPEYVKAVRYILNELLYNTLEHGKGDGTLPSILAFWGSLVSKSFSFHLVDIGVGIRTHLRQTYPKLESDIDAIQYALEPQVSGTFERASSGYETRNNAGVGLYFSSNILQRLLGEMSIVSGNGYLKVSGNGIVAKELMHEWKGTSACVTLELDLVEDLNFQKMLAEIRNAIPKASSATEDDDLYLNISNYFGRYAEDKDKARKLRDERLLPAISEDSNLILDFEGVESAPHSLLNALLATPIERLGLTAYKRIKILNAAPDIRETLDFIFDDNTSNTGK